MCQKPLFCILPKIKMKNTLEDFFSFWLTPIITFFLVVVFVVEKQKSSASSYFSFLKRKGKKRKYENVLGDKLKVYRFLLAFIKAVEPIKNFGAFTYIMLNFNR